MINLFNTYNNWLNKLLGCTKDTGDKWKEVNLKLAENEHGFTLNLIDKGE